MSGDLKSWQEARTVRFRLFALKERKSGESRLTRKSTLNMPGGFFKEC
jgi:hypothetical protein